MPRDSDISRVNYSLISSECLVIVASLPNMIIHCNCYRRTLDVRTRGSYELNKCLSKFWSVFEQLVAGTVAPWLVRSFLERAVWVRALAGDTVLCSWARHLTLTAPLSTLGYKWVPANLINCGVVPCDRVAKIHLYSFRFNQQI